MSVSFQVVITPPSKRPKKDQKLEQKPFSPPKLTLAPFHPTPEIAFGELKIGETATCELIIFNPTSNSITVCFSNIDFRIDRVGCNIDVVTLNSAETCKVIVTWSPIQKGSIRKVLKVKDCARGVRTFDVIVTGTCSTLQEVNRKMKVKKQYYCRGENKENREPLTSYSNTDLNFPESHSTSKITPNIFKSSTTSLENLFFNVLDGNTESYGCFNQNASHMKAFDDVCLSPALEENRRTTYEVMRNPSRMNLPCITDFDDRILKPIEISPNIFDDSLDSTDGKQSSFNTSVASFHTANESVCSNDVFKTPLNRTFTQKNRSSPKVVCSKVISSGLSYKWKLSPNTVCYTASKANIKNSCKGIKNMNTPANLRIHNQPVNTMRQRLSNSAKKKKKKTPSPKSCIQLTPRTPKYVPSAQTEDPFARLIAYNDDEWLDRQEMDIIKWMNSLLTPSAELDPNSDTWTVDAAEVWAKSSRDMDIKLAPSKEYFASILYHCPQQLDTLRKAANALYRSDSVSCVLIKLSQSIECKKVAIRGDRDLHLDQGLRFKLLQLLSFYNPLWLRIGLETIYNQRISVQSKSDVGGLGIFIRKHLFTDEYIVKNHSHPTVVTMRLPSFKKYFLKKLLKCFPLKVKKKGYMKQQDQRAYEILCKLRHHNLNRIDVTILDQDILPSFEDAMKKFILKKFLTLIYFLDQAKMKKLIRHDPCLFTKSSECKSSNAILLEFCSDLVVGHGDIIKHLKYMKYILSYKQTCLDEYDYSISGLLALRDGVHITRILEILFAQSGLCSKLRVPAISRLQKIHNVKVAMDALQSKCNIEGGIMPKDIVKGHREKILSLLWQIINNYLTPKYNTAAIKIQKWWRKKYFRIVVQWRIEEKKIQHVAAIRIQNWWRKTMAYLKFCKYVYVNYKAKIIEEHLRTLNSAAAVIQQKYRANKISRQCRNYFLKLKSACVIVQRRYRANKAGREIRNSFIQLKSASIVIQRIYIANKKRKHDRESFLRLRYAAICIQRWYRANKIMKENRVSFLQLKSTCVNVQRKYRANKVAREIRNSFVQLKSASIVIQRIYIANKKRKHDRESFLRLRYAAICIQRWYRANKIMKENRVSFLQLKSTCVNVQRKYRANKVAREIRNSFVQLKSASIVIQRVYIANKKRKHDRESFLRLRYAAICIQRWYRANKIMKENRVSFLQLKSTCVNVQRKYRANKVAREIRNSFVQLKSASIVIQRVYIANKKRKHDRESFLRLKYAAVCIQRRYRANKVMKENRVSFLKLKSACVNVQRKYRANKMAREIRNSFVQLKSASIVIQRIYIANKMRKHDRESFLRLKCAAVYIQRRYRANKVMKENRVSFLQLKSSCINVQRRYRANKMAREIRNSFVQLKSASIVIQRIYIANKKRKHDRESFLRLKCAAVYIQRRYRANKVMKENRVSFLQLKSSCINVQRRYRANKMAREIRNSFVQLKSASIVIQRIYIANKKRKHDRESFLRLKCAAVYIQRRYRANKVMKENRVSFLQLKSACVNLQRRYRANKIMREIRNSFVGLKTASIVIQRMYRANKNLKHDRESFLRLRYAAVCTQRRYRANQTMKENRIYFLKLKAAILVIQKWYRDNKICRPYRHYFLKLKTATILIQRRLRNNKINRIAYRNNAAIKIQATWRGYRVRKMNLVQKFVPPIRENEKFMTKGTLDERYRHAINQLQTSQMYSVVLTALYNLEKVTSLSEKLCEAVTGEGVIDIILGLIKRTNRSVPALELCRVGISVLINLSRHQPTTPVVWNALSQHKLDGMLMLIHIMKYMHDKLNDSLFLHGSTLLWILIQNDDIRKEVAKIGIIKRQLEQMVENLKKKYKFVKNKKLAPSVPSMRPRWYPDCGNGFFDDHYFAAFILYNTIYN